MNPEIFQAAVAVAKRVGVRNLTRRLLAEHIGKNETWIMNNCTMAEVRKSLAALPLPPGEPEPVRQGQPRSTGYTPEWRAENKQRILAIGLQLAESQGYRQLRRTVVADAAGCGAGTFNNYWGSFDAFREAVLAEAVRTNCAAVIAQGLADRHPTAMAASSEQRAAALEAIA